jgi:hypothetical protein
MSLTNSTLRAAGGGSLEMSTGSAIDEAPDNPSATSPKPNRWWSPGLNFLLKKQVMLCQNSRSRLPANVPSRFGDGKSATAQPANTPR